VEGGTWAPARVRLEQSRCTTKPPSRAGKANRRRGAGLLPVGCDDSGDIALRGTRDSPAGADNVEAHPAPALHNRPLRLFPSHDACDDMEGAEVWNLGPQQTSGLRVAGLDQDRVGLVKIAEPDAR
jgi:hypothetical protein